MFFAVRDYLGVSSEHLPESRKFQEGGEIWLTRPLYDFLLLAAARETIFLLELSHLLQLGVELPVRRTTRAIIQSTVSLTHQQEDLVISSLIVPPHIHNI